MFEIKGKSNTAVCYASVVEDDAIEQIRRICDYEFTKDSKIRIMPDVHSGEGCTIGTTMTISDKVVPNIVGVDIGCGMYTVKLGNIEIDFEKIDKSAHFIPSGRNVWKSKTEDFDLTSLKCFRYLVDLNRLENSLGTLGGGNHFIEIDKDSNGGKYLVIHTGSRNLGKQVAKHYQKLAVELNSGKTEYFSRRDELIKVYTEQGRQTEIQSALKNLQDEWIGKPPSIPDDLCYLYGTALEDYLHDVKICQNFAKRNREKIAGIILEQSDININSLYAFHTVHNYIDTNEMILRKGAISARKDELILIPINMRDGSVLAIGKGNAEWNFSAPHGAGRIMPRKKAKDILNIEEYKNAMKGIYSTSINEFTIDEAPMAYKSFDDIVNVIGETADIVEVLKPIYNFKATE